MTKVTPMTDADFNAKGGAYFDAGVHEVYIDQAVTRAPEGKSPFIEVTVLGENDEKADIRMYTSEKAAPYTIANLARIAVHNKQTDDEKQKVRDAFKKITDTNQLDDKFLARFEGMQAWILTEEDTSGAQKPNGGYYLRSNLYSYEPKMKQQTAEQLIAGSTPVDSSEVPFN